MAKTIDKSLVKSLDPQNLYIWDLYADGETEFLVDGKFSSLIFDGAAEEQAQGGKTLSISKADGAKHAKIGDFTNCGWYATAADDLAVFTNSLTVNDATIKTIYGGAVMSKKQGSSTINTKDTGISVTATGDVAITMNNASATSIYGGGAGVGSVLNGNVAISLTNSKASKVYGGGRKGAVVNGDIVITVDSTTANKIGTIYAGGYDAAVNGDAVVKFTAGEDVSSFNGVIYGSGRSGSVVNGESSLQLQDATGKFRAKLYDFDKVELSGATGVKFTNAQTASMKDAEYVFSLNNITAGVDVPVLTWDKANTFNNVTVIIDQNEQPAVDGISSTLISSKKFKKESNFSVSNVVVKDENGIELCEYLYDIDYAYGKKGGSVVINYKGATITIAEDCANAYVLTKVDNNITVTKDAKLRDGLYTVAGDDIVTLQEGAVMQSVIDLGTGKNMLNVEKGAEMMGDIILAKDSSNTINIAGSFSGDIMTNDSTGNKINLNEARIGYINDQGVWQNQSLQIVGNTGVTFSMAGQTYIDSIKLSNADDTAILDSQIDNANFTGNLEMGAGNDTLIVSGTGLGSHIVVFGGDAEGTTDTVIASDKDNDVYIDFDYIVTPGEGDYKFIVDENTTAYASNIRYYFDRTWSITLKQNAVICIDDVKRVINFANGNIPLKDGEELIALSAEEDYTGLINANITGGDKVTFTKGTKADADTVVTTNNVSSVSDQVLANVAQVSDGSVKNRVKAEGSIHYSWGKEPEIEKASIGNISQIMNDETPAENINNKVSLEYATAGNISQSSISSDNVVSAEYSSMGNVTQSSTDYRNSLSVKTMKDNTKTVGNVKQTSGYMNAVALDAVTAGSISQDLKATAVAEEELMRFNTIEANGYVKDGKKLQPENTDLPVSADNPERVEEAVKAYANLGAITQTVTSLKTWDGYIDERYTEENKVNTTAANIESITQSGDGNLLNNVFVTGAMVKSYSVDADTGKAASSFDKENTVGAVSQTGLCNDSDFTTLASVGDVSQKSSSYLTVYLDDTYMCYYYYAPQGYEYDDSDIWNAIRFDRVTTIGNINQECAGFEYEVTYYPYDETQPAYKGEDRILYGGNYTEASLLTTMGDVTQNAGIGYNNLVLSSSSRFGRDGEAVVKSATVGNVTQTGLWNDITTGSDEEPDNKVEKPAEYGDVAFQDIVQTVSAGKLSQGGYNDIYLSGFYREEKIETPEDDVTPDNPEVILEEPELFASASAKSITQTVYGYEIEKGYFSSEASSQSNYISLFAADAGAITQTGTGYAYNTLYFTDGDAYDVYVDDDGYVDYDYDVDHVNTLGDITQTSTYNDAGIYAAKEIGALNQTAGSYWIKDIDEGESSTTVATYMADTTIGNNAYLENVDTASSICQTANAAKYDYVVKENGEETYREEQNPFAYNTLTVYDTSVTDVTQTGFGNLQNSASFYNNDYDGELLQMDSLAVSGCQNEVTVYGYDIGNVTINSWNWDHSDSDAKYYVSGNFFYSQYYGSVENVTATSMITEWNNGSEDITTIANVSLYFGDSLDSDAGVEIGSITTGAGNDLISIAGGSVSGTIDMGSDTYEASETYDDGDQLYIYGEADLTGAIIKNVEYVYFDEEVQATADLTTKWYNDDNEINFMTVAFDENDKFAIGDLSNIGCEDITFFYGDFLYNDDSAVACWTYGGVSFDELEEDDEYLTYDASKCVLTRNYV